MSGKWGHIIGGMKASAGGEPPEPDRAGREAVDIEAGQGVEPGQPEA
jgi:hypothetical protein